MFVDGLSYPIPHSLLHGISLTEHLDEFKHRMFAICVAQGMHTALHLILRAINGYRLNSMGVVCGGLSKNAYEHTLPDEFQQDIDLVEFYPHMKACVILLLQAVKGISRLQTFRRQSDVILGKVVERHLVLFGKRMARADNGREMIVKESVRLDVGEWSNRAEQIQTQLAQLGVDIKTNDRFVSAMRVLLSNCQVQLNFM